MKLDYLDLYLIHWPVPGCYTGTWLEMAKLLETGRVLSIGVSNFQIHHLEELKKISGIVPAVNQIECHPLCYPKELIEYCQSEGIQVQAYAPLARGAYLDNDVMCVLGTKYAHTPAQVGLRWAIQKGISVIPKSVNPDRIASNANIFDFNIEDEDMAIMDTLNEDLHTSHVPDDLKDVIFNLFTLCKLLTARTLSILFRFFAHCSGSFLRFYSFSYIFCILYFATAYLLNIAFTVPRKFLPVSLSASGLSQLQMQACFQTEAYLLP